MKEQRGHLLSSGRYSWDLRRGAGFVDAHVHYKDASCLDTVVDAGVAAVRDAGMRGNSIRGISSIDQDSGLPLIISARWALYKKGGYGSLFGVPVETREEIKSAITRS